MFACFFFLFCFYKPKHIRLRFFGERANKFYDSRRLRWMSRYNELKNEWNKIKKSFIFSSCVVFYWALVTLLNLMKYPFGWTTIAMQMPLMMPYCWLTIIEPQPPPPTMRSQHDIFAFYMCVLKFIEGILTVITNTFCNLLLYGVYNT